MVVKEALGDVLKPKTSDEIENAIKNLSDVELVKLAISKNSSEILRIALERYPMDPEAIGLALKWGIQHSNDEITERALDRDEITTKELVEAASLLTDSSDLEMLEVFMEHPKFDPSLKKNQLFRWAATQGHKNLLLRLLKDPRVDPSDLDNAALKGARVYEHDDIVKILMQDERVKRKLKEMNEQLGDILRPKSEEEVIQSALQIEDPNELLNVAVNKLGLPRVVKIAMERGADPNKVAGDVSKVKNDEIIKILLEDPKTNVSPNALVYKATKMGLEDELIKLIKEGKLDPGQKQSILLVWAVGFGRDKLVKALLKHPKVKPENEKESVTEALAIAIARGNNDLVRLLLKDPRIDPSADSNRPIKVAAQFGNKEMVELLLKDDRVDPSASDLSDGKPNFALRNAAENNHLDIVSLLLKNEEVRKKLSAEELKKYEDMTKKIVRESLVEDAAVMAEPRTKPTTKPGVKPGTKRPPSPIRRERPSVTPRPKATADDVAKKFLDLIQEK